MKNAQLRTFLHALLCGGIDDVLYNMLFQKPLFVEVLSHSPFAYMSLDGAQKYIWKHQ